MEPTILGLILDSSVVIEAERQHLNVAAFPKQIDLTIGEREAALSSIAVAERAHGIYRADTEERRARRRAFLDDLNAALPAYSITETTAEIVGMLMLSRSVPVRRGDLQSRVGCQ